MEPQQRTRPGCGEQCRRAFAAASLVIIAAAVTACGDNGPVAAQVLDIDSQAIADDYNDACSLAQVDDMWSDSSHRGDQVSQTASIQPALSVEESFDVEVAVSEQQGGDGSLSLDFEFIGYVGDFHDGSFIDESRVMLRSDTTFDVVAVALVDGWPTSQLVLDDPVFLDDDDPTTAQQFDLVECTTAPVGVGEQVAVNSLPDGAYHIVPSGPTGYPPGPGLANSDWHASPIHFTVTSGQIS